MSDSPETDEKRGLSFWPLMGAALTLIFVWGTAFNLIAVGIRYVSPVWLVVIRCFIGSILVFLYMYVQGKRLPEIADQRWVWYSVLGFIGITLPFILISTAQMKIDSGISAILVAAMPIITIILAHFFAEEPLSWQKFVGFLIGFIGIVLLFLPDDFSFNLVDHWEYQLLILLAALCYAMTTVMAKRAPQTDSVVGAAMMLIAAAVFSGIAGAFEGLPQWPIALPGWLALIGLAVGSTAIGTILYLFVIERNGPSTLAKINYFPPVAAVCGGVFFLNEPFTWQIGAAFLVILFGVVIARS